MAVQGEAMDRVAVTLRGASLFSGLSDEQLRQAAGQATLLQLDPARS